MSNTEVLLNIPQEQVQQSRLAELTAQGKQLIGRTALSISIAISGGAVAGTAESVINSQPAEAVTTFSNDYPDSDATDCAAVYGIYSWCKGDPANWLSPRAYGYRNCTDGVAYWVKKYTNVTLPNNMGNAENWETRAAAVGYAVKGGTSNSIEPGDIAQSDDGNSGLGHVEFVTEVTKDGNGTVTSFKTASLNKGGAGEYTGPDVNTYSARNTAGKFTRGGTNDWDNFIDVNGANKGLGNEPIGVVDSDADTIPDPQDDCPVKPGVASYYGCPVYNPPTSNPALTAESSGGTTLSSWGNQRLDLFRREADGTLNHRWYDNGTWWGWIDNLGGNLVGKPAATSWGWGRIDLFGVGPDNKLKHKFLDNNTTWSGWETLSGQPGDPGCIKDGVSAVATAPQTIHIVAHGCDNAVKHFWLNNNVWQPWTDLGGYTIGTPSIASWGPGRLDVFARGGDNGLYTKYVGQNGWSNWAGMGGCLSSSPAVTAVGFQRLDVFARGCANNELLHKPFRVVNNVGNWFPWEEWGGNISGTPTAVSWNTSRMDVVAPGTGTSTQHFYIDRAWPASGWTTY